MLSLLTTRTNFSIAAAVGFMSLFGVSVLGGVILVSRIQQLREEGVPLRDGVSRGSDLQLRPVLMAALSVAIGLFPPLLQQGSAPKPKSLWPGLSWAECSLLPCGHCWFYPQCS